MLNIPDEQIYTLYEYEDIKEELTFKDILFNMIYDIKQYLGISVKIDYIRTIVNQDILNKYLDYLKSFLDPYLNNFDIIKDTRSIYNKYKDKYINNIPNQLNLEDHTSLLDVFLNDLLNNENIKKEYYSFT